MATSSKCTLWDLRCQDRRAIISGSQSCRAHSNQPKSAKWNFAILIINVKTYIVMHYNMDFQFDTNIDPDIGRGLRSCQKREIIRISQSYNAQQQLARGCAINISVQPMLRWYCNHKMTFSDIGKGHISQAACIWRITVFFLKSFHIRRGIFLITGRHNLIQKLRGHISIFHQTTIQI